MQVQAQKLIGITFSFQWLTYDCCENSTGTLSQGRGRGPSCLLGESHCGCRFCCKWLICTGNLGNQGLFFWADRHLYFVENLSTYHVMGPFHRCAHIHRRYGFDGNRLLSGGALALPIQRSCEVLLLPDCSFACLLAQ